MDHFEEKFNQAGVARLVARMLDKVGMSEFELANRAGMYPGSLYNILRGDKNRKVRRQTIRKLADAAGYRVTFDQPRQKVILDRRNPEDLAVGKLGDLARELTQIVLDSGRTDISEAEINKLKEVVKVLLAQ